MSNHWTATGTPSILGNFGRFVWTRPLVTAGAGNDADEVDFNTTFENSDSNPWVFTTSGPASFSSGRNDPV